MGDVSDKQLATIAKANAPRKLGNLNVGAKKVPSALRLNPIISHRDLDEKKHEHVQSSATMMGAQSQNTNDQTIIINPSVSQL